jgi:hypothetical protein
MKKLHLVAFLILTLTFRLHAQNFGGFPPSVKWRQINTDTARIIFPAAADSQAQEIAAIIFEKLMWFYITIQLSPMVMWH